MAKNLTVDQALALSDGVTRGHTQPEDPEYPDWMLEYWEEEAQYYDDFWQGYDDDFWRESYVEDDLILEALEDPYEYVLCYWD